MPVDGFRKGGCVDWWLRIAAPWAPANVCRRGAVPVRGRVVWGSTSANAWRFGVSVFREARGRA